MNADRWIAVAAVAATLLTGFVGPILSAWFSHYLKNRSAKERPTAQAPSDQPVSQQSNGDQRFRIRWVVRIVLFLIQTTTIFLLYRTSTNITPVTRSSVLMTAIGIGVICLCIALNWFIGIYENMDAIYGYIYATADAIRYDMRMQEKRVQQELRNPRRK
ncbi:MAG TPA: hypothetical protein VE732_05280 [Nitrososphaera sp.]|jgi:MFS family permease|nr:hypothetical protein [Nitrososphaera sp.]